VEHGNLAKGQYVVAGDVYGKVRTLSDFAGKPITQAGPATPATITGLKTPPQFGDTFKVVKDEKAARQQSSEQHVANKNYTADTSITGTDLLRMMNKQRDVQEMNVVIKVDVQGSLTSIKDSLRLLENDELVVRVVGSGVGNITERDVNLAASSGAVIYGFNVQLSTSVKRLAKRDKVPVKIFNVIYELLDDVRSNLESLLQPEVVEEELGELEVKGIFRSTRDLIICGGKVLSGKITPGTLARIKRNGELIDEVEVTTVQRQQQEVKEVFEGELCGLSLKTAKKLEVLEGDKLEIFKRELKQRKLS
jgi:translation initiation factor IF-2